MDKNKSLENIANSFYAAAQVKDMLNSNQRGDSESQKQSLDLATLRQLLNVITRYSPDTYKNILNKTCEECDAYSNTYRNLKHHLSNNKEQRISKHNFVKTVDIIKPVLGKRQKDMAERIFKLYEAFK